MGYFLEFTINGLPKTTNSKRGFGHWAQYHREGSHWKRLVLPYILSKRPINPLEKAKLTLIRASSVEPDYDGLVSSFKHVIDALVEGGIIANDKYTNVGRPDYQWKVAPRNKGFIKVTVEEIK